MNDRPGDAAIVDVPMLIDGAWVESSPGVESRDPYRGELVSRAPEASPAEVEAAPPARSGRRSLDDQLAELEAGEAASQRALELE